MSTIEVAFPYRLDDRGRTAIATHGDHVQQMLELLLFTRPGERVNQPTFGCGLLDQVFAPNSPEIAAALNVTIAAAISLWLRDVLSVTSVDVTAQQSQLIVDISYVVLATGSPASVTLPIAGGP
jgi:uncharacterized protein